MINQIIASLFAKLSSTVQVNSVSFLQSSALIYVLAALLWRIFLEPHRKVRAPALRGWDAHSAEAKRVHEMFRSFLAKRSPGALASINRSRGGESDSNRTISSDYKKNSLKVDVSHLDGVIAVDRKRMLLHIEPGLPMDELARISVAHGVLPLVVLEFPGITAGGAISGGGIESSSHKHGSFFDTIEEVDVITGDGRFLSNVSRTNEADLFYALSASYGTQAILTRIAVRVEHAPKFVHVRYVHCDGMASATLCMEKLSNAKNSPSFIDGVAMSHSSAVVVVGEPCDVPPPSVPTLSLRNNRFDPWFFWHLTTLARAILPVTSSMVNNAPSDVSSQLSQLSGHSEVVTLEDYLFRFDRGAFWMARHGLEVFYGRASYSHHEKQSAGPAWILRVKYAWLATTRQLYRMLHKIGDEGLGRTYVVQDYVMPGREEACALSVFTGDSTADACGPGCGKIDIWPLWVCPVRMVAPRHPSDAGFGFPVQKTQANGLMFNVGVYGLPNEGQPFDPVLINRALEQRATKLGGRKMLYAQSFYSAEEFWALFDRAAFERARKRYGGGEVFPCISTKLLLGEKRLQAMRGKKPVSFGPVLGPLFAWYGSLWLELLTPRFLHSSLGIHYTGMTYYEEEKENDNFHVTTSIASPKGSTSQKMKNRRGSVN
jgi:delta24-sterol reductase